MSTPPSLPRSKKPPVAPISFSVNAIFAVVILFLFGIGALDILSGWGADTSSKTVFQQIAAGTDQFKGVVWIATGFIIWLLLACHNEKQTELKTQNALTRQLLRAYGHEPTA